MSDDANSDALNGGAEDAPEALGKVDPDAPPAEPNEERPTPEQPVKDQGDALEEPKAGTAREPYGESPS